MNISQFILGGSDACEGCFSWARGRVGEDLGPGSFWSGPGANNALHVNA
jgi:hypothetical protein